MNKPVSVLLALLLSVPLFAEDKPAAPSGDDVSYALGMVIGQSLSNTGIDLNLDQLFLGIKELRTKDKTTRFELEKAKQMVSDALTAVRDKQQAARVDNEKTYLADHGKKQGVTTTATGLQYEVLKQGTGAKPKAGDTVKVDYVGTLADGTEFDSSIKRGEPAVFPLAQVIPAWTEGLQLMAVGSKFRFTVPSSLAYGPQGAGDVIPPYSTLIFEVELLGIEAPTAAPAQ